MWRQSKEKRREKSVLLFLQHLFFFVVFFWSVLNSPVRSLCFFFSGVHEKSAKSFRFELNRKRAAHVDRRLSFTFVSLVLLIPMLVSNSSRSTAPSSSSPRQSTPLLEHLNVFGIDYLRKQVQDQMRTMNDKHGKDLLIFSLVSVRSLNRRRFFKRNLIKLILSVNFRGIPSALEFLFFLVSHAFRWNTMITIVSLSLSPLLSSLSLVRVIIPMKTRFSQARAQWSSLVVDMILDALDKERKHPLIINVIRTFVELITSKFHRSHFPSI